MIAKLPPRTRAQRTQRKAEPLQVRLTVDLRFGLAPEQKVSLLQDRPVPLAGSIFDHRDAVLRGLARLLMKASRKLPRNTLLLGGRIPR